MEQKIMKTVIAIMVAILAAAIVVACSQDDTVPGPVKSVVSITAVDTSQDVNFDGVDIRAEPDTQDSGQDSKTRSVAHTPGSISAVRRDTPDSEDSEGFIRDSWMGPDVTADVESDTTEDLQPETTTTKLDITQLIDTNNSGSQAKDTNGNQQDVSANQNEAMSPTDTLPDTSVQQEDTSSGLLDIFKSRRYFILASRHLQVIARHLAGTRHLAAARHVAADRRHRQHHERHDNCSNRPHVVNSGHPQVVG